MTHDTWLVTWAIPNRKGHQPKPVFDSKIVYFCYIYQIFKSEPEGDCIVSILHSQIVGNKQSTKIFQRICVFLSILCVRDKRQELIQRLQCKYNAQRIPWKCPSFISQNVVWKLVISKRELGTTSTWVRGVCIFSVKISKVPLTKMSHYLLFFPWRWKLS